MDFWKLLSRGFTPSTKICAKHNGHVGNYIDYRDNRFVYGYVTLLLLIGLDITSLDSKELCELASQTWTHEISGTLSLKAKGAFHEN